MVHLHMTPAISHIRVYVEVDGYNKRLPYIAILTIFHMGNSWAYLMGAVGTVNRETRIKAFEMLREQGIVTVMLERHGRMLMRNL